MVVAIYFVISTFSDYHCHINDFSSHVFFDMLFYFQLLVIEKPRVCSLRITRSIQLRLIFRYNFLNTLLKSIRGSVGRLWKIHTFFCHCWIGSFNDAVNYVVLWLIFTRTSDIEILIHLPCQIFHQVWIQTLIHLFLA